MVLPREELAQMGVTALTVCSSAALGTTTVAKNAPPLRVTPSPTNSNLVGVFSDGKEGKGIKRGPMPSEMQREQSDAKMSSTLEREHLKMFSVCFICGYGRASLPLDMLWWSDFMFIRVSPSIAFVFYCKNNRRFR